MLVISLLAVKIADLDSSHVVGLTCLWLAEKLRTLAACRFEIKFTDLQAAYQILDRKSVV